MTLSPNTGAARAGTIRLGDLTVNRMGFAAMRLCGPHVWGMRRDRGNAHRVLHRAFELGVNFIDTADNRRQIANVTVRCNAWLGDFLFIFGTQARDLWGIGSPTLGH